MLETSEPSSGTVMTQQPKVLRPYGYPAQFNTPRDPQSIRLITRKWLPMHKLWTPLEVALFMPTTDADLIATFNRIPLGTRPFAITFESHLPRLFGYEDSAAFRYFTRKLADTRCRAIIPISKFARGLFLRQQRSCAYLDILKDKLTDPIHPNIRVPEKRPRQDRRGERALKCVFVGGHFIRKGGLSVLHAARRAHEEGLPIEFHIVSDMTMGAANGVWTDPNALDFANDYLVALKLPNLHHHGKLANSELLALLHTSDVSLLPTLSDTYGYSVIESFAMGVPVIGTACCALPEIIEEGVNGFLIDLPVTEHGVWAPLWAHDHDGADYIRILRDTTEKVGARLLAHLATLAVDREKLEKMSVAAFDTARYRFAASKRDRELEALYHTLAAAPYSRKKDRATSGPSRETASF